VATTAALAVSFGIHSALIAVGARWLTEAAMRPRTGALVFDVALAEVVPHGDALPAAASASPAPRAALVERVVAPRTGPIRDPRPDTRAAGRGGTAEASERAVHLSDSVEAVTLEADPTLLTASSQASRLATAAERRSREDRRTTPNPMELTFVSSGSGARLSRLAPAPSDPTTGTLGAVPVAVGARQGAADPPADGPEPALFGAPEAGAARVPQLGVDRGTRSEDYRRSAAVALARPAVRPGRASISTTNRGRPADTLDSAEEVASVVQSLITASTAGGRAGRGPGGVEAGGAPGRDGVAGAGAHSRPSGDGGDRDDAASLGLRGYAAGLTRKVYPYWDDAFPMWARAEGLGGVAVIGVTLTADGQVRAVHVVRPSGFPEFDAKVARALEQAAPYGVVPLAFRDTGLTLHIAFDAMNAAVGRAGPGPGRR
jgi:TonB family protein